MENTRTSVQQALDHKGYQAQLGKPDLIMLDDNSLTSLYGYTNRLEKAFEEQAEHLAYLINPVTKAEMQERADRQQQRQVVTNNLLAEIIRLSDPALIATLDVHDVTHR